MKLILFARDDSAAPNYTTGNYHRFDVVDILDLPDEDLGSGVVNNPNFLIIDCECTYDDVRHLKEESIGVYRRIYSLDGLPAPYYEQLLATGRQTIPLGIIIANQRIKA